jgi:tetratricopeptide (TPR) repeat protein
MRNLKIIAVVFTIASLIWLACETVTPPAVESQLVLTELGWQEFLNNDLEDAEEYFLEATEADAAYADAWNGLGWIYLKNEDYLQANSYFSNALTIRSDKISVLVGLAYSSFYYTNPDQEDPDYGKPFYEDVVMWGEDACTLAGDDWNWTDECADTTNYPNNRDSSLSSFDVHMITALGYFNLTDMPNTIAHINDMRRIIGESEDFDATTWDEIAAELLRLEELDPS